MSGFTFGQRRTDALLVLGTALLLLICPVLAARPSLWPGLVALSLLSSVGLVILWKRDPLTTGQVLWGALLLRLAFLPLLPGLTDDLYRYIWDGWLQIEGINPYRYAPSDEALRSYQSADIYEELNSQEHYTVYPPLSQIVFFLSGWFYSLDWTVSYYVLKGVLILAEFGGVVLLSRLTAPRTLLLYAWNPLVLIETAGQGHTEALLVPFLVGLMWAVRSGRGRWASIAVTGAGMIKLYPFVLGPYLLRRFGWAAVWPGALFGLGLFLPYAAPYTLPHLKSSVDLFAHLLEFNAGFYYLTKYVMWLFTGADWSKVIGPTFRYLFLSTLPFLYYLDWRRNWSFRWAALLTLGLFLVFSTTVHPWYFVPMFVFCVLGDTPTWPWFWVGGISVGTYLFYIDGPYWSWVILGWGGAALLALWLHRHAIQRLVRWGRRMLAQRDALVSTTEEFQVDSR